MRRQNFGKHLILDGYGAKEDVLWDLETIYELLNNLPEIMGLKKISPPWVLKYRANKKEDSGLSGFVFIAESHISIHTFPEHNYASIDVYSCRDFDLQTVTTYVQKTFDFEHLDTHLIERGTRFKTKRKLVVKFA